MNSIKLEYPISKKDLHKGFNIKKRMDEKVKKEFLDKYVKDQLDIIAIEILKNTIHEYMYNELNSNTSVEYSGNDDELETGEFINQIQKIVKKTEEQKKYIIDKVREMQKFKYEFKYPIRSEYAITQNEFESIKLKIFEELKVRFPDCLIQIDPLKTYILIDWN
jgi:hypothetical protein